MTNEPAAAQEGSVEQVAQQWKDLLDALVPPTQAVVEDVTGQEHRLRVNMPAAVEVRILRRLRELAPLLPDLAALARVEDSMEGRASVAVDAIITMCSDEQILAGVAECFAMAHPAAVRRAREAAEADDDLAELLAEASGGQPLGPQHLFSAADLVGGIIPFGLRAAARTGHMVGSLLP